MTFIKNIQGARITGSITASFTGDGSGLTGIISASHADTASYVDLVAGTNITINQVGTTYTINSTGGGGGGGDTFPYTGSAIISGSLQVTGSVNISGSLVASGLSYPTVDQENGDVLTTDGTGNLSFEKPTVYAKVKNATAGTLPKGMPVHASSSVGNVNEVIVASASNAATMPATFILAEQLTAGQEGLAIATGFINGVDTSGFGEGQVVYVAADGGYTNVKPTGSNLIQNLGIVTKADINGSGFVLGAGRSNDVPNITEGYAWIGNADGVATPTATSSIQNVISSSFASTASYAGLYSGNGTIPLNTTASVNGDLLFQGLDEDTRLIVKDGNGGSAIHLFSDGNQGQSALEFRTSTTNVLLHKIQMAGGDTRYVSNNRDLLFTTDESVNTEGFFIQAGTGNMGIGTITPTNIFDIVQNTEKFTTDLDNASGPIVSVSTTDTNNLIRFGATDGISSINIGTVGSTWTGSTGFGVPTDNYVYSNSSANGLNIISQTGTGTEDYIRLYAGGNPSTATASIHIDGDGANKGWVGIGTETPANPLHVYSLGSTYVSKIESGVSTTRIRFQGSSTTNEPWIGSSANSFQIGHVSSGETLTVTETGNVGIGTDVPADTLTVLGSFNLREYGVISGPTSTAGWYRLGYTTDGDRGGIRVVISYTGGSWTPVTYVINAFKNWTDVSSLSLEKYGSVNYITEARIVEDEIDSTTYHLEVYLASLGVGHEARVYFDKNLGYEGTWNLNTGSLSASTSTATPVARSPFTSTDGGYTLENLIINDNVNNWYWKFEDTSGSLEIKDWNSDNLITFDGVNDRVGIGTTTPNSTLDVNGNAIITGSLTVTGGITGSLLGTASYADNVLFEPGTVGVNSTQRKDSSNTATGNYSLAIGLGNTASGIGSLAIGTANTASGDRAVALGRENIVSGARAYASGFSNLSSQNQTFAHGYLNTASTQYAVAIGRENTSAGIGSIALGYLNYLATGSYSFAAGYNNNIVPSYAGAIGYGNTILSTYGMAFGFSNQAGNYAVAAGYANDASAIYSVALGGSNTASGNGAVALGTTNQSLGSRSTAAGYYNTASADYSVAAGYNNVASGQSSITIGEGNLASTSYGIALGLDNTVSSLADVSVALGSSNLVTGNRSVAIGSDHSVSGNYSGVFAGYGNDTRVTGSVILGGYTNTNLGTYTAIVGGQNHSIDGANYSAIIGGQDNSIGAATNTVIIGGSNINAADTNDTVFVPNLQITGSVQAPNISNTETAQVVYYNTSSGAFTYSSAISDQTKIFSWFMNVT